MEETHLQLIWQHRLFRTTSIQTKQGEPIQLVDVGTRNIHQGPDFVNARMHINHILWVGNIEIDHKTSYWKQHHHANNPHYSNVILHVVWENDMKEPPHNIPILELRYVVSKLFLHLYQDFFTPKIQQVPCKQHLPTVEPSVWETWKEKLVDERLHKKVNAFHELLRYTEDDWEQAFWVWVARYVGGTENAMAFEEIAKRVPISILYKEKKDVTHIEALLLGVAGLLSEPKDEYSQQLQEMYKHFEIKYRISPIEYPLSYFRMRPPQLPDIRLAQLSSLLYSVHRIIELLENITSWNAIFSKSNEQISSYWKKHYRIGKESEDIHLAHMGKQMQHHILINVFCVCYYAYAGDKKEAKLKIDDVLKNIKAEKNHIIKHWFSSPFRIDSAKDSQALLQLQTHYCDKKRCLECAIGKVVLCRE